MNKRFALPVQNRRRIALILLAAFGLFYQSLLVRTHLPESIGRSAASQAADATNSLKTGPAHKTSQCLLCALQELAEPYTTPSPPWVEDSVSVSDRLLLLPALVVVPLQQSLPTRYPRGPPTPSLERTILHPMAQFSGTRSMAA